MSDLTVFPVDLAEMSVSQLANLPPAQLVEADANLDHLIDWAKKTRTKLDAALDQRFGDQGRTALRDSGRDFGTAHTRQRLEAIGAKHSKIKQRAKPREFNFAPGTVLLREWGEREHKVTVSATGQFEYEGRPFKSLTAVARYITGARWSGPLFFGLAQGGAK